MYNFIYNILFMANTNIISSPVERTQETVKIAYNASTNDEKDIWQDIKFSNTTWNIIERHKSNLYDIILWFWAIPMQKILVEFKEKTNILEQEGKSELEAQDIISEQFLKGEFVSGNPYNISKERIKLLLKWFNALDTKKWDVYVVWMRHGHRVWPDLTDVWRVEAKQTWESLDLWDADMLFGTHQTIIESMLISLVWGSKWLSVQEAREALPSNWQEPYKTAQATEFFFTKDKAWKKLTVVTNWAWRVFTEEEVKKAYYKISDNK